jgi:hypothetical protein
MNDEKAKLLLRRHPAQALLDRKTEKGRVQDSRYQNPPPETHAAVQKSLRSDPLQRF